MQKIEKFWHAVQKQSLKVQFWAKFDLLTLPTGGQEFFRKSENVTFLQLCCSNFVQNIKNFWHADPQISALPKNEWIDEAEVIGPFRLKLWVQ